jgi:protein-tyrosine phosphatase
MLTDHQTEAASPSYHSSIDNHLKLARIGLLLNYLKEPVQTGSPKALATQMTPANHPMAQLKRFHQGKGISSRHDAKAVLSLITYLFEQQIDVMITCSNVHYVAPDKEHIVDRLGNTLAERSSSSHPTVWDCFAPYYGNIAYKTDRYQSRFHVDEFKTSACGRLERRQFRLMYRDQNDQVHTKLLTQMVIHDWEDGTTYDFSHDECAALFNILNHRDHRNYYVHCMAGIGRSGSIIRAYLTHSLLPLTAEQLVTFLANETQRLTHDRQTRHIFTSGAQFIFSLNLAIQFRLDTLSRGETIMFYVELKTAIQQFLDHCLEPYTRLHERTSDAIDNQLEIVLLNICANYAAIRDTSHGQAIHRSLLLFFEKTVPFNNKKTLIADTDTLEISAEDARLYTLWVRLAIELNRHGIPIFNGLLKEYVQRIIPRSEPLSEHAFNLYQSIIAIVHQTTWLPETQRAEYLQQLSQAFVTRLNAVTANVIRDPFSTQSTIILDAVARLKYEHVTTLGTQLCTEFLKLLQSGAPFLTSAQVAMLIKRILQLGQADSIPKCDQLVATYLINANILNPQHQTMFDTIGMAANVLPQSAQWLFNRIAAHFLQSDVPIIDSGRFLLTTQAIAAKLAHAQQQHQQFCDTYINAITTAITNKTITLEQWSQILNTLTELDPYGLCYSMTNHLLEHSTVQVDAQALSQLCQRLNVVALTSLSYRILPKIPQTHHTLLFRVFALRTGELTHNADSSVYYSAIYYASCAYLLDPQNQHDMLDLVVRCWHHLSQCEDTLSLMAGRTKPTALEPLHRLIANYFNDDVIMQFNSENQLVERLAHLPGHPHISVQKYIALAKLALIFYEYEPVICIERRTPHPHCCNAIQALVLSCRDVKQVTPQAFAQIFVLLKRLTALTKERKHQPDQALVSCAESIIQKKHDQFLIEQTAISKSKLSKCLSRLSLRHRSFPPVVRLTHIVCRSQSP